jgi:hypothetical protein
VSRGTDKNCPREIHPGFTFTLLSIHIQSAAEKKRKKERKKKLNKSIGLFSPSQENQVKGARGR